MPLIVDTTKCPNHEAITQAERYILGVTGMHIGLGRLDEKTLPEWVARIAAMDEMSFKLISDERNFTVDELRRFIPTKLNVSDETRSWFLKKCKHQIERVMRDAEKGIK